MQISCVYVVASNQKEAELLAETLLQEKLIACANILPKVLSVFKWEGKNERIEEVGMFLKANTADVSAIIDRIKALHSYECPCIEAWPIAQGNLDFEQWVIAQTSRS